MELLGTCDAGVVKHRFVGGFDGAVQLPKRMFLVLFIQQILDLGFRAKNLCIVCVECFCNGFAVGEFGRARLYILGTDIAFIFVVIFLVIRVDLIVNIGGFKYEVRGL